MSKLETSDETIMFSCQTYEVGVDAPYPNTELLKDNGTRIKPTNPPTKEEQ